MEQQGEKTLYMVFIELEKTYDKVPKGFLQRCLKTKNVHVAFIREIKGMYDEAKTQ